MTGHKNQPFYKRVGFALAGIGHAVRSEQSARIQVGVFVVVVVALLVLQPGPFWWALVMLASAGVFAAEMFNTAIEHLADHLHPEIHPQHPRGEGLRRGGGAALRRWGLWRWRSRWWSI